MGWKAKGSIVALLLAATAFAVAAYVPRSAPIHDGTAEEFWQYASGVVIDEAKPSGMGGVYLPRDGWMIYYHSGFHGQFLFRVKQADAVKLFPKVVAELKITAPEDTSAAVYIGFERWRAEDATGTDAVALLKAIHRAQLDLVKEEDPDQYTYEVALERGFDRRWQRIQRYPMNIAFEIVYLCGMVLFAAWPWLRNGGPIRWGVHFGLLPLLLFLPYFLGYSRLTFTSTSSSGGVLYPDLLLWFRSTPWTSLDISLMRRMPTPLAYLSQSTGPMLSLSGGVGGIGPFAALWLGTLLGGAVFFARYLMLHGWRPTAQKLYAAAQRWGVMPPPRKQRGKGANKETSEANDPPSS